jgi:hypothetical protein
MRKKTLRLALAAATLVALASPAAASAEGTLFDQGIEVTTGSHVTLDLSGRLGWDIPDLASSYECDVHSSVTLKAGHPSHGTATLEFTTETCEGTGVLTGCELESHSTNSPLTVDVTSSDLRITNFEFNESFQGGCFMPASQRTFPEIMATPDATGAISALTLSGAGSDHVTGLPMDLTGELAVEGSLGTYGLG